MWSQQIFVALLCTLLACQQVTAVVNNGPSSKIEESPKPSSDKQANDESATSNTQQDSLAVGTEEQSNRREAPALSGSYGAPIEVPAESYLPSGSSNLNLPVPVYGAPDAPSNNVVYPAPPPDIPPPVSLPSISYGLPQISSTYGAPFVSSGLSVHTSGNLYNPPHKFSSSNRIKPVYGPPRFQYGPPGKPFHSSKFNFKFPYKSFGNHKKIPGIYGPPTGYIKDSFASGKFNFKNYKILSHGSGSFNHHAHGVGGISTQYGIPSLSAQHSSSSLSTQYGAPALSIQYGAPISAHGSSNLGLDSHAVSGLTAPGPISPQYGVPDVGHLNLGIQSLSTQYGVPNDNYIEPPQPHYGPPQPSPHPRPPHPGAPAPPTPPDIKYDGWQPIPGLVSRIPTPTYGVPSAAHHIESDLSYNNDLSPPPLNNHIDISSSSAAHGSLANLALEHSHRTPQHGASDSYAAPLNTVTGSGGIVSSSGDEAQGKHLGISHDNDVDIGLSTGGAGQDIQTLKSVEYELFSGGAGTGHNHGSGGYSSSISNSYGAPFANSYSNGGTYAAGHFYDKLRSFGSSYGKHSLGSSFGQSSFGSHNSHKNHGYKGLSLSSSGIGLIPPSGVYGVPPSGHYGTPLYSSHGSSFNALKINPPKYPVIHGQPIPPSVFESITKQHGHGFGGHKGGSTYLPPSVPDLTKPLTSFGPHAPSSLYSLPSAHSSISFQSVNHGSSDLNFNFGGATQSALSSYGVPLNSIDGSYTLPQGNVNSGAGGDLVEIDFTHPGLTIDLTKGQTHAHPSGQLISDCSLKAQNAASLNYGLPSGSGYSGSVSGITTNIDGGYSSSSHSASLGQSAGYLDAASLGLSTSSVQSGASIHSSSAIPGPVYGAPEALPIPSGLTGYQNNVNQPHDSYGAPDLDGSHSQKSNVVKINTIDESQGKSYGKQVAASFGPSSELIQSQSIDLNNIPLKGALGSYTLQIQSADGSQSGLSHGQVLNDGLLQSILAAIEQPKKGEKSQPIDFQKSLEKQNFVTNDTLSSVVGQLADAELRYSTQLVKDEIDKTQELADADSQASSAVRYVLPQTPSATQETETKTITEEKAEQVEDATLPLVEDNGIALYFSNKQRSKKGTEEKSLGEKDESNNSH